MYQCGEMKRVNTKGSSLQKKLGLQLGRSIIYVIGIKQCGSSMLLQGILLSFGRQSKKDFLMVIE